MKLLEPCYLVDIFQGRFQTVVRLSASLVDIFFILSFSLHDLLDGLLAVVVWVARGVDTFTQVIQAA